MRIHRYVLSILLVGAAGLFMGLHTTVPTYLPVPLEDFPASLAQWRLAREETFSPELLKVLRPTDYLYRVYTTNNGDAVHLYIGYHDGTRNAGQIHSPKNCLPGGGWYEVSSRKTSLPLPDGSSIPLVEAVYKHGETTEVMLYWFEAGGVEVTNEYAFKLKEVENSIFRGRRDAAFVRIGVTTRGDSLDAAFQQARRFLGDAWQSLRWHLPS
ncbi:exosortase C-terminal domain/associated protein EpsI [Fundidesulfovibrio magnetotacticus]|nr:exosortase C-terminal domain/associated protein EpsI [Fundidesulfovibrio magnetotacticus]